MEPTGLALGVAGLTALFSTCVQCWGYISRARSFSQEFAIQQTKLDIEKTLFLQWGRRVRIIALDGEERDLDQRLTDNRKEIQYAVTKVLMCLKQLLTNTEELRMKYGIEETMLEESEHENLGKVSQDLMSTFEIWQNTVKNDQSRTSLWRKTRWACRDKDKFVAFVNEISYFNEKLQTLTPADQHIQHSVVHEAIQALANDLSTLHLIRDASKDWHRDWSDAATNQIASSEGESSNSDVETARGSQTFEIIDTWRHRVSDDSTETPRRSVGTEILAWIAVAEGVVQDLSSILNNSWCPSLSGFSKSYVCAHVLLRIRLSRKKLKERTLPLPQYELLHEGVLGWKELVLRTKTNVHLAKRVGNSPREISEEVVEHLCREVTELVNTLDFVITIVCENNAPVV